MTIPLFQPKRQNDALRTEIQAAVDRVLDRSDFVLGSELAAFEEEFAAYCEARHCIGVGCGLDALTLTLRELGIGPGHEVITAANTFIATALAVQHVGATPVVVDCDPDTLLIDPLRIRAAVTSATRAIIPVHLYGQPADMDAINEISLEFELAVIEDACQAHGAKYRGRRCGSLGRAAAFSFHPSKNLAALGDGGAIVTNDDALAARLRAARNYGTAAKYHHLARGFNSRLDCLQAAVLRVKLRRLDEWNARRRELADRYRLGLESLGIPTPIQRLDSESVCHLFVVRCPNRDEIARHMQHGGVETGVHYPVPVHRQKVFLDCGRSAGPLCETEASCREVLSLPMCPLMTEDEVDTVLEALAVARDVAAACTESEDARPGLAVVAS